MSIRIENLSHIYEADTTMQTWALRNVSVEIEDGTFVGLIGHTGSGKSTLVQHLNGLMRPDEGTVYFNGEDIFAKGYDLRRLRGKVGLVFQYPEYQMFEETVLKDVMFGPLNLGMTEAEAREAALEAMRLAGVEESSAELSPFEHSGGQKRRIAIAGVLAMNPEVLILDEPTAGLDPGGREEILDTVARLHRTKKITVILVSHSMEDVARYAQKLLVLDEGKLRWYAPPVEVFRHMEELEAMGLSAPELKYLAAELNREGIELDPDVDTVEETRDAILRAFGRRVPGAREGDL